MDHDKSLLIRLNGYFADANPLLQAAGDDEASTTQMNAEQLASMLVRLRYPLEHLRDAACSNVWRTAGLGTNEVRISSALAKLWDANLYGTEGRMFLARCLSFLGQDRAPGVKELARGYQVQTEHCPNGDLADRVDITVETVRSIIGIEVKIHAREGERQLKRYVEAIGRRAVLMRKEIPLVVFLSSRRPSDRDASASWVTWHQIADAAAVADPTTPAGSQIIQFGQFCRKLGE